MKQALQKLSFGRLRSKFGRWSNTKMDQWGLDKREKALAVHMFNQLYETAIAVVPITLHLVICMAIFFQRQSTQPGLQAAGLIAAIIGLTLFVDGLRVCVMPLGELVGRRLPEKFPLPVVLTVAFCLGILCTYAEPAISSLRPLAEQVDRKRAPYLHFVLMEKQEILVLCIGLGVGVAAVLGTVRFVKGWSLKPFIAATLAPTVACACYMHWGNPELRPLLGLCWDSGAVTTGPVTVPVLLSMGIGVMKSVRQKRLAKAVLKNATSTNTGQALEGFGVVTLASLLPILAVELMSIVFGSMYTTAEILAMEDRSEEKRPVEETSPVQEVVYAIRAILPLIAALMLIVLLLLREKLPKLSVYTMPKERKQPDSLPKEVPAADPSHHSGGSSQGDPPAANGSTHGAHGQDVAAGPEEGGSSRGGGGSAGALAAIPNRADIEARPRQTGQPLGEGLETRRSAGLAARAGSVSRVLSGAQVGPELAAPAMSHAASAGALEDEARGLSSAAKVPSHALSSPDLLQDVHGSAAVVSDSNAMVVALPPEGADELDSKGVVLEEDPTGEIEVGERGNWSEGESEDDTDSESDREEAYRPGAPDGKPLHEDVEDGRAVGQPSAHDAPGKQQAAGGGSRMTRMRQWRYWGLTLGICMCLFGMILFNLGLTYGFTALGNQVGSLLPAAYLEVEGEPRSPYYDYIGGIFLVEIIIFLLGILATRAEPALNVLGRTVEALSGGVFSCKMLVWAVALGVGVGMAVGATKILFGVPIMYIILIKYFIVVILTIFSKEDFTNIAWDSAGVTTGPVTVPFVLAIGVGFSGAVNAQEGFGILTTSSVAPIISVLFINLIKKPAKKVGRTMRDGASTALNKASEGLGRLSRSSKYGKNGKRSAEFRPPTEAEQHEEGAMETMLAALRAHKRERMLLEDEESLASESVDNATQSGRNTCTVHMNRLAELELNSSQRDLISTSTRQALANDGNLEDRPTSSSVLSGSGNLGVRTSRKTRFADEVSIAD